MTNAPNAPSNATSQCLYLLSRGQTCPPNANQKKKKKNITQRKQTHRNHEMLCVCHGFRRYQYRLNQETASKACFRPAFAPAISRPRACCNRFKSNKTCKFLGSLSVRTTYMTSSCTQGPLRPGFFDAKCSCIFLFLFATVLISCCSSNVESSNSSTFCHFLTKLRP